MAKRDSIQQSKHDQKVEEEAIKYKEQGYDVWADIQGWSQPALRNNHCPDVVAKKTQKEIIIEVETEDSIETDTEQIESFKRYASARPNTEFKLVIAY